MRRTLTFSTFVAFGLSLVACGPSDSVDTGAPVEPETYQEFLLNWYADYDADQSTDYLDAADVWDDGIEGPVAYDVLRDAAYGPHGERTTMDVYVPRSAEGPMPLVIFIHGGGFRAKSKEDLLGNDNREQLVLDYLSEGVAVASINYRFRADGGTDTVVEPDWNCTGVLSDGCRQDVIYRDGARAVQYLRYRSGELGIDPDRIGAWGRSAGSQIVTWIGVVPDLAVVDHPDPVLRESTRLQAIGHSNSQATGPSHRWPDLVTFRSEGAECDQAALWERLASINGETGYVQSLQSRIEDLTSPHGQDLLRVVDFLEAMDESLPPLMTSGPVPDLSCEQLMDLSDEDLQGKMVHHARHSEPVIQRCELVGAEVCHVVTELQDSFSGTTDAYKQDEQQVQQFMLDTL